MGRLVRRCPKCEGVEVGPRYCNGIGCDAAISGASTGSEHLHYQCSTCGYKTTGPCRDSEDPTDG